MASPVLPMVALTITAYANDWYNTGDVFNVKPLLFGGVATIFLELFSAVPGMQPVATMLGWSALLGYVLAGGGGAGTPVANLNSIASGKGK
jgi:hypothetical protein